MDHRDVQESAMAEHFAVQRTLNKVTTVQESPCIAVRSQFRLQKCRAGHVRPEGVFNEFALGKNALKKRRFHKSALFKPDFVQQQLREVSPRKITFEKRTLFNNAGIQAGTFEPSPLCLNDRKIG